MDSSAEIGKIFCNFVVKKDRIRFLTYLIRENVEDNNRENTATIRSGA